MDSQSREELLSAYLDDELSADERATVETWLAEDAAYRQLLDDLRALRSGMQSLARHKLGRDLSGAVLRRAERAVLAGEAPSAVTTPVAPSSPPRQWWSRRNWRMVVWPAIAAAAALFIALFDDGQRPAERQVAQQAPREAGEMVAAKRSENAALEAAGQSGAEPRDVPAAAAAAGEDAEGAASVKKFHDPARQVAAPAPAQSSPGLGAATRGMLKQATAPADAKAKQTALPELVICDVAETFIDERTLEKLLDEKKLAWEHARVGEQPSDAPRLSETDKSKSVGKRYVVHATPDELAAIVSDLSARKDFFMKVESRRKDAESLKMDRYTLRSTASDEARAARQPVIFWLRPVPVDDRPSDDPR